MKISEILTESWSQKYKSSINCSHPKGFSQKAHCAGKKKHNESVEMEMTCPDCGMCETHGGTLNEIKKGQKDSNGYTKCWPGKHAEGTKKGKNGKQVRNCVPNESLDVKKKTKQVLGTRRHTNEATDPKFVGFMNKALGDKADPEPITTKLPADYSKFQVMSFDNMPGYKPAFKFGLNVLKAMDQKTRQRFINAPDDDLIVYMLNIADKKGFMPKHFVEEDLDEVTDWFDEIFADPNLNSWTDLLKSMSGKPGVAEASYNKNTKHLHTEIIKLNVGNWVVYVDDHAAIRSMVRSIGPRMMYDIIYYVDKIPNLENRVPIGGAFWIQDNKTNSSFYFKRLDIPGEPLAVRCETGVKDVPRAGWKTPVFKGNIYQGPEAPQHIEYMKKAKLISGFVGINPMASTLTRNVQKNPTNSKNQSIITNPEMQDSNRYERAFLKAKKLKDMSEDNLNEFVPPSSNGGGEDERSRRLRKLLEIAIQVAKEKNVDELGMIHAMNMIAGDEFFNVAVEGLLPDITDREYMYVLESAYKTVKQGLSEGMAQDEAEEYSGWRAEFVNQINYNTFEVKMTNTRSKESANFIVRPVDMISHGPTLQIETMDVHDLQTGRTESWTSDDPQPDGGIVYAIAMMFWDNKELQKKLWNIVDTHNTKGQDMMPGLQQRRSIGQEVDADAYIDSHEKTQSAMSKMKKGVSEDISNLQTIIKSFVNSPIGQKYKQHDCKTVTRAFVQWAEQNKIPTQVVLLAPPSADFIAKNPQFQSKKGKPGEGDGHIMPIVNGEAIDFTFRQFGVKRPFENPLTTPAGSLPSVYGKFGYFTDNPNWFPGGKSQWIGALNAIPPAIFNQNFGDKMLERKVAENYHSDLMKQTYAKFFKPAPAKIVLAVKKFLSDRIISLGTAQDNDYDEQQPEEISWEQDLSDVRQAYEKLSTGSPNWFDLADAVLSYDTEFRESMIEWAEEELGSKLVNFLWDEVWEAKHQISRSDGSYNVTLGHQSVSGQKSDRDSYKPWDPEKDPPNPFADLKWKVMINGEQKVKFGGVSNNQKAAMKVAINWARNHGYEREVQAGKIEVVQVQPGPN